MGSIRRIFDFLEAWGLINYTGSSKPQLKWEEKESKSATATLQGSDAAGGSGTNVTVSKSKPCSNCKGVCSFACFASDKVLSACLAPYSVLYCLWIFGAINKIALCIR